MPPCGEPGGSEVRRKYSEVVARGASPSSKDDADKDAMQPSTGLMAAAKEKAGTQSASTTLASESPLESPLESEDSKENTVMLSPPGLQPDRTFDDREEGQQSPLKEGMLDVAMMPPPGLGAGDGADGSLEAFEAAQVMALYSSPDFPACAWASPSLSFDHMAPFSLPPGNLQATSLPCEDWKTLFPSTFISAENQDNWESLEPALVHSAQCSPLLHSQLSPLLQALQEPAVNGRSLVASPFASPFMGPAPAYVHSASEPTELSENELLSAENTRLAMENELLKSRYMAAGPGADWSGYGNDMSWAGMNPFFATPWGYLPNGQIMPMWNWGEGEMPGASEKSSRARTDSALGDLPQIARQASASAGEPRSRSMSDVHVPHVIGEAFGTGPYTTVMLRNLPNNYSRTMLLKLIDIEGFGGQYDFIYLPMDFKSHASLGYAFVNLIDAEQAAGFFETFEGFHRWVVPSQKVCSVNWSHPYQGLEAHIERYRNSPVMHEDVPDDYKPMVFHNAERIVFPPPTKKLKVPRMRPGHEKADGSIVEEE